MVKIVEGFAARLDVPPDTCRKSGVQVFDDTLRGFGVRKYPDGRAHFFIKYSIGGKQGRHTLGSALERGGLKDARKEATRMLLDARAGRDPLAAKKAAIRYRQNACRRHCGTILSALSMPSDRPNHSSASLSQLALGSDSPSWLPALFLPAPEQGRFSGHAAADDLAPMPVKRKSILSRAYNCSGASGDQQRTACRPTPIPQRTSIAGR